MSGVGGAQAEAERRFDELQARLVPLWESIRRLSDDPQTIVVVPSVSLDLVDASHVPMQAYEERMLFMLLLLRQPNARLVYVTSEPIPPRVVDYYLDLLPGIDADEARARLFLVAAHDGSSRPLTRKLLEQPETVARIRELVVDPRRAHLVPFVGSDLERALAVRLDIPMYAADSRHAHAGTKSGSRQLFAEEGVRHAAGVEGLHGFDEVVDAIVAMREADPSIAQVIVKLDEGVSGDGNALVTLGDAADRDSIRAAVDGMQLEADDLTLDEFASRLSDWGGVVEARITGDGFASPSVQMRVTPLGELEVLSTHDQLLGGHDGQSYVGCVFPADPAYARTITEEAIKVGRRLARDGVIGRFAVDFVVVRAATGGWQCDAIEINLRKGGTTHPFLTLQYLTDGRYESATATFTTPSGARKCLVASDRVESEAFVGLTPDALFAGAARHGLSYDPATETGIVFHMLASLGDAGRFGMTAVADSVPEAHARFAEARAALEADAAREPRRRGWGTANMTTGGSERILADTVAVGRVPGLAAAVVADGRVQPVAVAGGADAGTGATIEPDTAFLWFSMTKVATATAVMRLVEAGTLSIDDEVAALVPGVLPDRDGPPVRVRHLLQHSSGIPNPPPIRWVRPANTPAPDPDAFLRRRFARVRKLRFDPGTRAAYTNLGYLLLGAVVTAASGRPFVDVLRDEVLDPLGMHRTGFVLPALPASRATGHQRLPRGLRPALVAALPPGIVGSRTGQWVRFEPFLVDGAPYGGLVGPVGDAARLLLLHASGGELDGVRLLSLDAVREMQAVTVVGKPFDHGLGWFRPRADRDRRPAFVEHYGGGGGYHNLMRLHAEQGVGVVVMGNSTSYDVDAVVERLAQPWLG